jgi:hypothetical protein
VLARGKAGIRTFLRAGSRHNEEFLFKRVLEDCTKLSYAELVQFHAWCNYLCTHTCTENDAALDNWMRVVRNLAKYTAYENSYVYRQSLIAIEQVLLPKAPEILVFMATQASDLKGFFGQQMREERIKAGLLLRGSEWTTLIEQAEGHGYFDGQIEFLLKYSGVLGRWLEAESASWDATEDELLRTAFSDYLARASLIFEPTGLKEFGGRRWERALLAIGNYLLPGSRNLSFLVNDDRDQSWKRLLRGSNRDPDGSDQRRDMVKRLLDLLDTENVVGSLDRVISEHTTQQPARPAEPWRYLLVCNPALASYCEQSMIRMLSDTRVYLLKKLRMSGEHAELFTYDLLTRTLKPAYASGSLAPFNTPAYSFSNSEADEPDVYMDATFNGRTHRLRVSNAADQFRLTLPSLSQDGDGPLFNDLLLAGWELELGVCLSATVGHGDVLRVLQSTALTWRAHQNQAGSHPGGQANTRPS